MWMEGVEGEVKAGGARCAPRTKIPRVMWHKLRLLNLAPHCFHTRERMVMLIRLDSLKAKKKKPTNQPFTLRTTPSASLNPTQEAEVLLHRGGGSCTDPAPRDENPPALPHVLGGGGGKSVFVAGIGWKTRGWGQREHKAVAPALERAWCCCLDQNGCVFGRTISVPVLKLGTL